MGVNMRRKIIFCILYLLEFAFAFFILFCCGIKLWWLWLLLLGLFALIIIKTIALNNSIHDWECQIKDWDYPELTFEEFYSLYTVMPENFGLNEFSVNYKYRSISFKTYIDYCKYRKFIKRYKEQEEEMERTETQADLIKMLQRDLAAKQEESDQWVKENIEKNVHVE